MQEKLKQGEHFFLQGNLKEAEQCFRDILDKDSKNKHAYNNLGVIGMFVF